MADHISPDQAITITLGERLRLELAQLARDAETTESELIETALEGFVRARHGPGIPRYARRLGPIALAEDGPSAA